MENKFDIGDFVNVLTVEKTQCDLVNRVRERRKEMGLTQKELAKRTGYSYSYIRRIEAPKCSKNFSILTLYNICKALNISISSLFDDDDI